MSVGNILSKLKEINESNVVSVFVPSVGRKVKFKPLSVKQQKDLIKTGLDGALSGVTISNVISQIIIDNTTESLKYLITDKFPIILSLRKQAFGSEILIKEEEKSTKFDLDVILEKQLTYSQGQNAVLDLENTSVTAELDLVTLEDDIKINNFQLDKLKKNKEDDLSETVGSLFIYEIVKFVSKINLSDDDSVSLKDFPIKDRLTIIESLPATLNNKILEYIQIFRKEETEYITVSGEVLPVDARLFSKE